MLDEGGFEVVTKERKWPKIAVRLCYQASKNIGSTLRHHYEKTLYPFDVSMAGVTSDMQVAANLADEFLCVLRHIGFYHFLCAMDHGYAVCDLFVLHGIKKHRNC